MSLLSQTASVAVSFHFNKRRGLANGLATTGSGLGFFVFPPMTTYLLEEFGLRGTCFIMAGIMMQGIVFGALVINSANGPTNNRPSQRGNGEHYGVASLVRQSSLLLSVTDHSNMYFSGIQQCMRLSAAHSNKGRCSKFFLLVKDIAKASFDVKLLRNAAFMLYLFGTLLRQLVGYIPSMFIVSRALMFGISYESSGFLMSVFGITNIVGRLLFGFLADTPPIRQKRCYLYGATAIGAGAVSLVNFGEHLAHQMVYCGLYGLLYGKRLGCTVASNKLVMHTCTCRYTLGHQSSVAM